MKKFPRLLRGVIVAAGLSLGVILTANPASAEMNPDYIRDVLGDYPGWPLALTCSGSDVNVRTSPDRDSAIVTTLQPKDIFYVKSVITQPDFVWFGGVTEQGEKGYVVHKYFYRQFRAEVQSERFRAAFNTSRLFAGEDLAAELELPWQYDPEQVEVLKEDVFPYAPHRYKVGNSWIHGVKDPDGKFHAGGVILRDSGHKVAGLEVGQTLTPQQREEFSKNMTMIGWEGPYETDGQLYWYLDDVVDRQPRPVQGFAVFPEDGIIKEIRYWYIPID